MKLRRMLALTLVLMTLMTAALAADDPGLYYIGDDATPENLTGHTRIYNAVDAAPGWRYATVLWRIWRTARACTATFAPKMRARCPSTSRRKRSICTSSCWARRKAIRCTFGTTTNRRMRRCRLRFGWNGEIEHSIAYENPLPIPALGVNSGSFYVISLTEPSNLPSRKRQLRRHVRRRTRRRPLPSGQARRTT